jgi:hypothetical protein
VRSALKNSGCRTKKPRTLRLLWSLLLLLLCASSSALARAKDSAIDGKQTLSLTTVVFSGHRYAVAADFGLGTPVPLMVHGNARMFLALTHDIGEKLNGGPVKQTEAYGYSAKGKGTIHVPTMRLGTQRFSDLHDVPVFDFTPDGVGPVHGMVGVPFLVGARAAIDFSRDVMILGVKTSTTPNRKLLAQGYRYIQMTIGPSNRVTMPAYFPSLDSVVTITPSTVSTALTLHHPLFAGKTSARADTTGPDHSPSGTSPDVFLSDDVAFAIAGVTFHSPASLEDFAEYANTPASELRSVGLLGFDWMKAHAALIDYANRYLYFKP